MIILRSHLILDLLSAKIRAQLRRSYELKERTSIITDGDITIDLDATTVYFKKNPLVMTTKEYALLLILIQNKGKTLHKEWLFEKVWGMDSFSEPSTLTVHINKIQRKNRRNT